MKPILFNTKMVKAILEGRKTVTRRVIKPQPQGYFEVNDNPLYIYDTDFNQGRIASPYQVGDVLYVRETWQWCPCWDCCNDNQSGCVDETAYKIYSSERKEYGCYGYKASTEEDDLPFERWHPSIHMPKKAARIFLRVTNIRVERLQDVTQEDAKSEGTSTQRAYELNFWAPTFYDPDSGGTPNYIEAFKELWDSTVKKEDLKRHGWDANPWVWAIEFERCEPDRTMGCGDPDAGVYRQRN